MSPAVPSLPDATRRLQAALVLIALAGAVVATAVLVSTPASPDPAAPASRPGAPLGSGLRAGLRVDIRGGDPSTAWRVADVLARRGAQVQGVRPAPEANPLDRATAIVYYDRRDAGSATLVRRILKRGWVRHEQVFHPGVDVTIVLGKDEQPA